MAVLVTGGAGYIGSHMAWTLLDAGEDAVVIDRLSTGHRWAIPPEARFYEGDIADAELLKRIFSENEINAIIRELHENGLLKQLSEKYQGQDLTQEAAKYNLAALNQLP